MGSVFFCSILSIPFFKFLEKINSGQSKNFFFISFIQSTFELLRKEKERKRKERKFKDKIGRWSVQI